MLSVFAICAQAILFTVYTSLGEKINRTYACVRLATTALEAFRQAF